MEEESFAAATDENGGEIKGESAAKRYWAANVRLLCILLTVWFAVSFGAGILFVDLLNKVRLGGFPLGFWFAQQGATFAFIGITFAYVWRMKAIDRRFGLHDET